MLGENLMDNENVHPKNLTYTDCINNKNIKTKKVEITVQNHGFVVSKNTFPSNLKITHTSLFDGTIAGIEVKNKPFFSVQYHPESSPGPQDSRYLFDQFIKLIKNA